MSVYNVGDPGSIPGLGRAPGEGNGLHSSTIAWKIPWTEVPDIVQETGSKTIPKKKKCKRAKWLSEEALQIAVKEEKRKAKEKRKDISI